MAEVCEKHAGAIDGTLADMLITMGVDCSARRLLRDIAVELDGVTDVEERRRRLGSLLPSGILRESLDYQNRLTRKINELVREVSEGMNHG